MNKEYGTIEISEGFIVGNYYKMSKQDEAGDIFNVQLKYLGEKEGYKNFLDEDELEIVEFLTGAVSCNHDFGTYTILSNKNVLTWRILSVNFEDKRFTLKVEKDGQSSSSTISLDFDIKKLARNIGVNL